MTNLDDQEKHDLTCSFCGAKHNETKRLIASNYNNNETYICEGCVIQSLNICLLSELKNITKEMDFIGLSIIVGFAKDLKSKHQKKNRDSE